MTLKGHCLCGAVTWSAEGPVDWSAYCHCADCRRNCAAPVTAYFGVPRSGFRWTGTVPAVFASSPGVRRHFCATCGTPMAYDAEADRANIHLYAATLDDPRDFTPQFHVQTAEALPWFRIDDDLPRHERFRK